MGPADLVCKVPGNAGERSILPAFLRTHGSWPPQLYLRVAGVKNLVVTESNYPYSPATGRLPALQSQADLVHPDEQLSFLKKVLGVCSASLLLLTAGSGGGSELLQFGRVPHALRTG